MRHTFMSVVVAACLTAPAFGENAPVGQLDDRAEPLRYAVDLVINPQEERFSGRAIITVRINEPLTILWLHGDKLNVKEALFTPQSDDAEPIAGEYEQVLETGVVSITFDNELPAGEGALSITYDAPFDENLTGLYKVVTDDEAYAVTQMQDIDARQAFPGFDEPRFKTPFEFSITAPTDDVIVFNTPETGAEDVGDGLTKRTFAETPPLPTYLIAMAVGPYDLVSWEDIPPNDVRDRAVPLRGLAAEGRGVDLDYALEHTDAILTEFETYFGSPYPYRKLDLIAAPDFAYGAMENPGAIIYRQSLLLMDKNSPLSQRRLYALVHGHELAHQWFGNLVTPVWWDDIWLNESFATWLGNKAVDAWRPEGNFNRETLRDALDAMQLDALASTRQIREPVTRNEDIGDAFDAITYLKGGGVLSMMESYLGEETFRDGVRAYINEFADDVATADDFFAVMAESSERPEIISAFRSFIDQPGVPLITAKLNCRGDEPELEVRQTSYRPLGSDIPRDRSWQVPVCVSYPDGDDDRAKSCALLSEQRMSFPLADAESCPSSVMPNADGAGYYRFTLPRQGWADLLNDLDALSAKEAIAVADNLAAAFKAGKVNADTYLDGVEAFAASDLWDVASAPAFDLLSYANADTLGDEGLAAMRSYMVATYQPLFDRARDGDSEEDELLADILSAALVRGARDEALNEELAAQGVTFIEGGAVLGVEGGPPAYALSDALTAALWAGDEEFFEALLEATQAARSPIVRSNAIAAVSRAQNPDWAARVREAALAEDSGFSGRDLFDILNYQMALPETRGEAWRWLQNNFPAVIERIPAARRPQTPTLATSLTTRQQARDAEAFFTENADLIPGYERSLAQTLEAIALRRALVRRQGRDLANAVIARTAE